MLQLDLNTRAYSLPSNMRAFAFVSMQSSARLSMLSSSEKAKGNSMQDKKESTQYLLSRILYNRFLDFQRKKQTPCSFGCLRSSMQNGKQLMFKEPLQGFTLTHKRESEVKANFFPASHRKTFFCYWLLPLVGFAFYGRTETSTPYFAKEAPTSFLKHVADATQKQNPYLGFITNKANGVLQNNAGFLKTEGFIYLTPSSLQKDLQTSSFEDLGLNSWPYTPVFQKPEGRKLFWVHEPTLTRKGTNLLLDAGCFCLRSRPFPFAKVNGNFFQLSLSQKETPESAPFLTQNLWLRSFGCLPSKNQNKGALFLPYDFGGSDDYMIPSSSMLTQTFSKAKVLQGPALEKFKAPVDAFANPLHNSEREQSPVSSFLKTAFFIDHLTKEDLLLKQRKNFLGFSKGKQNFGKQTPDVSLDLTQVKGSNIQANVQDFKFSKVSFLTALSKKQNVLCSLLSNQASVQQMQNVENSNLLEGKETNTFASPETKVNSNLASGLLVSMLSPKEQKHPKEQKQHAGHVNGMHAKLSKEKLYKLLKNSLNQSFAFEKASEINSLTFSQKIKSASTYPILLTSSIHTFDFEKAEAKAKVSQLGAQLSVELLKTEPFRVANTSFIASQSSSFASPRSGNAKVQTAPLQTLKRVEQNELMHYAGFVKNMSLKMEKFKSLLSRDRMMNLSFSSLLSNSNSNSKALSKSSSRELANNFYMPACIKQQKVEKLLRSYFSCKNQNQSSAFKNTLTPSRSETGSDKVKRMHTSKLSMKSSFMRQLSKEGKKYAFYEKVRGKMLQKYLAFSNTKTKSEKTTSETEGKSLSALLGSMPTKSKGYMQAVSMNYSPRLLIENRSFILFRNESQHNLKSRERSFFKEKPKTLLFDTSTEAFLQEAKQDIFDVASRSDKRKVDALENERSLTRKSTQKKRRIKKLKKETRRRKKRKRFYPRPVWLRYRLFLKFIKERAPLGKVYKQNKGLSLKLQGFNELNFNKSMLVSMLSPKEQKHPKEQKQKEKQNLLLLRKNWIFNQNSSLFSLQNQRLQNDTSFGSAVYSVTESMHANPTKDYFTISRPVLGDLKRLVWKSSWLRSNLNSYLKRVRMYLGNIKQSTQKWDFYLNFKGALNDLGGFRALVHGNFSDFAFSERGLQNRLSSFNTLSNSNKWEKSLYFAEYNRVTYLRLQEFISQIRENFASQASMNGKSSSFSQESSEVHAAFSKGARKQPSFAKKIRTAHLSHSKIQDQKREDVFSKRKTTDFWVKLGKSIMAESGTRLKESVFKQNKEWWLFSSKDYKTNPTLPQLRMLWALSKTAPSLQVENSNLDSLTGKDATTKVQNFNSLLYKRQKLWIESGKMREQIKYNKTKKMYRDITKKFQTLLNEQYEIGLQNVSGLQKGLKNPQSSLYQNALNKTRQKEEKMQFLSNLPFNSSLQSKREFSEPWLNTLTNKSTYWWSAHEQNTLSTPLSRLLFTSFFPTIEDSHLQFSDFVPQYEKGSFSEFNNLNKDNRQIIWMSTLLFHFCTILSLLSISQIRDVLKFYLLGISKVYKASLGILTYSYASWTRLKNNYTVSTSAALQGATQKAFSSKSASFLKENQKEDQKRRLFALPFDFAKQNMLNSKNAKAASYQKDYQTRQNALFLALQLLSTSPPRKEKMSFLLSLLNSGLHDVKDESGKKVKGMLNNFLRTEKFKMSYFQREQIRKQILEQIKTEIKEAEQSKTSNNLNSMKSQNGLSSFVNTLRFGVKRAYMEALKNSSFTFAFTFAQLRSKRSSKTNSLFSGVPVKQKLFHLNSYILLYSFLSANFVMSNSYKAYRNTKGFVKQSFDLFGRFGPKSLFNFLEKPGELIIDWIAYMFLVEWSSDITNTIPENVDIYLGNSFYKMTRQVYSLSFANTFAYLFTGSSFSSLSADRVQFELFRDFALTQTAKGDASKLTFTNDFGAYHMQNLGLNTDTSILFKTPSFNLLNLATPFIQHRLYHLYEILLFQFYQPDTDLILRKKKAVLFWDIWGDFLMQVAEDSNINISELTSLKEEQIKLLEKSSELAVYSKLSSAPLQSNESEKYNPMQESLLAGYFSNFSLRKTFSNFSNLQKQNRKQQILAPCLPFIKDQKAFNGLGIKEKQELASPYFLDYTAYHLKERQKFAAQLRSKRSSKPDTVFVPTNFAAQQFLSYQGKDTELFIDLHPPKSFSMISLLKKNESVQTSIGSLVCQIFAGIMSKQISKNVLIIGLSQNTALNSSGKQQTVVLTSMQESPNFTQTSLSSLEGLSSLATENVKGSKDKMFENEKSKEFLNFYLRKSSNYARSANNNGFEEKTLLIQAIAGETELKIITDNAYRYAMVYRGVAVGIKLLRDVFDSLSLHTPCLFLIEDIHAIGERRPLLISDDEKGSSPNGKPIFGSQREEIHEKNQVLYQLSKHVITDYRKPYKGDFSLLIPTNHYSFDLFKNSANPGSLQSMLRSNGTDNSQFFEMNPNSLSFSSPKIPVQSNENSSSQLGGNQSQKSSVRNTQYTLSTLFSNLIEKQGSLNQSDYFSSQKTEKSTYPSRLFIKSSPLFSPPATSPFSLLNLKEEKKFKPYKIVSEMPWGGLPGEQLAQVSKASYSIRVKVAMLADMAISTLSVKLDMITDLLVIIDSVKGNRGFVVFATTHMPYILDPALRRPGRLDETITLGLFPNLLSRWHIFKSSFGLFTAGKQHTGFKNGLSVDLTYSIHSPFLRIFNKQTLNYKDSLFKYTFANSNFKTDLQTYAFKNANMDSNSYSLKQPNWLAKNSKVENAEIERKSLARKTFSSKRLFAVNKKILSQTYFVASNMLYEANFSKTYTAKGQNFIDFSQPLNMETSPLYLSLYASSLQFRNQIVKLMSGKLGEMFIFSNSFQTLQDNSLSSLFDKNNPSPLNSVYNTQGSIHEYSKGNLFAHGEPIATSFAISNTWKVLSSLILSFVQKRFLLLSTGNQMAGNSLRVNNNLIVPKFLFFNNQNPLYEASSPPSSNILLPARRYENYRRSFDFFAGKKTSIGISEKIQNHQQQRLMKKLYGFPVQNEFRSEISSLQDQNRSTTFTNATLMIGSFSSILQKTGQASTNWFVKNRILMRHKDYLTNQWWNGQLPEHNAETTFLSDIDWRYTFIESIGDLLLDFPDAEQHYNPRNRRWLLTKGDYHNWFDFEKTLYSDIYTHFIFDSFIKAYHIYEKNRPTLDFYSFYILRKGLYNSLNEFETLKLYKRFFN